MHALARRPEVELIPYGRRCVRALFIALLAVGSIAGGVRAQCQRQELFPPDMAQDDVFGNSVAIDGDWAIVGKPGDSEIQPVSGAAYLFNRVGSTWVQVQKLKASTPESGAYFGVCVAISGDVIVVGAIHDTGPGLPFDEGAAYVFERGQSGWAQSAKLVASDAVQNMEFGSAVAVDGARALIGVPDVGPAGSLSGSAYVFDRVGTVWTQMGKLVPSDSEVGAAFGWSVSVSGDRLAVGALGKDGVAGNSQGAAYMFENQLSGWVQTQELFAPDGVSGGGSFGESVRMSGDRMLIGAAKRAQAINNPGVVYAYTHDNTGWVQTQEFWPDDVHHDLGFGYALSISGSVSLIGAGGDNDAAGMDSGSAYVYVLQGSNWIQSGKLMARNASLGDIFGASLALSGSVALVGAPDVDEACPSLITCNSGAAYVFEIAPTATQYGHCSSGAPCNNSDNHGGCSNSTGQGAILAACGSGSVTTDDLQIELTHCPPHKSTLLFMGGAQVNAPFADGIRVVGGGAPGIYRFGIVQSDATGEAMRGPGLVSQSQAFHSNGRIQAGEVWNFQVWYRDPAGPCGHLSNYSNGVQVAFTP
jgi:hypothetical protein